MIWAGVLVASAACYALKLAGLSLPPGWLRDERVLRTVPLIPIALLAALVGTQTFATGTHLVLDVRAASLAVAEAPSAKDGVLGRLADEAKSVKEFLGDVYPRLEGYVRNLRKGAARGRTVDDILGDGATRETFVHEVAAWAKDYQVPSFTRDVKTLIKLKAFLSAKLA